MKKEDSKRGTRVWGAAWTEDGPIAEVRDVYDAEELQAILDGATEATFRWFQITVIEPKIKAGEGHSRGPCVPGAPCLRCEERAARWWFEYGRRAKQRGYYPCHAVNRQGVWVQSGKWGAKCPTLEEALSAARQEGFPFVCEMDGHGKRLNWIEVTP